MNAWARGLFSRPVQEPRPESWWQTRAFWFVLALCSTAPFWFSPLPPLGDLFNHMGRYHVMLNRAGSDHLRAYYDFQWAFVPNLGQDLLMLPVGWAFGVERGALLLSALIPPAMILAFRELSASAHGRVQPTALLALPFVFSYTYLFGFMNFETGVTVTLWSLVLWFRMTQRNTASRTPILMAISAVVLICHIGAWIIFLLAIGALESADALGRRGADFTSVGVDVAIRVTPLLAPGLLLLIAAPGANAPFSYAGYSLRSKLDYVKFTLRSEHARFDQACLAAVTIIPIGLALAGKARIHAGLLLFAAFLGILFVILPLAFLGGYYGDMRLLPVLWIAALLSFQVSDAAPLRVLVLAALALFGVRLAWMSEGWSVRGRDLTATLQALDQVPPGARLSVLTPQGNCETWQNQGLAGLANLAIVRRDAFVNAEWDIPNQNLLRPIYMKGTSFNSIAPIEVPGRCPGRSLTSALGELPRDRFDYVWSLGIAVPEADFPWLIPRFRGPGTTLYEIDHDLHATL